MILNDNLRSLLTNTDQKATYADHHCGQHWSHYYRLCSVRSTLIGPWSTLIIEVTNADRNEQSIITIENEWSTLIASGLTWLEGWSALITSLEHILWTRFAREWGILSVKNSRQKKTKINTFYFFIYFYISTSLKYHYV